MASHGVRKLGAITGIIMLLLLFIGGFDVIDLYIMRFPISGGEFARFYTWGYFDGTEYLNMLVLEWPSCLGAWLTTVSYIVSIALTLGASTPGSLPLNSKKMFAISGMLCTVHLIMYIMPVLFSSIPGDLFNLAGPAFYILVLFVAANFISLAKVK